MSFELVQYYGPLLQLAILVAIVFVIVIMSVITYICIRWAVRKVRSMRVEEEASSKQEKTKPNYVVISILVASGIAAVFMIIMIAANKEWGLKLSPDNIVLTFVGIIATFLVVTNYAQVSEIRKEMEDKLSQSEKAQQAFVRKVLKDQKKDRKNRMRENNGEL